MGQEGSNNMENNLARKEEIKKLSYADLLEIDDDKRYELIDGELYLMSSPRTIHQRLIGEIYRQIGNYLIDKKCQAFVSPLDVKLSGEKDDTKEFNVVQPDVMVVCDENKIAERNILGAPDLVVEVLSPSNKSRDKVLKLNMYQKFGVKEYWIVSPEEEIVETYILNEQGMYTVKAYFFNDEIKVNILNNCNIDLKEFATKPKVEV